MYISPKLNVLVLKYFGGGKYLCTRTFNVLLAGFVYDTVGVSTAVSVMSVVQSERQFSPALNNRG